MEARQVAVGIDIGGTFTDVVCRAPDGSIRLVKIPTTRSNPGEGVRKAVDFMLSNWGVEPGHIARFVHGTTAATNAVLERKGAKIGLLTTRGFKDVLEIGRQMRHSMYDLVLKPETPVFLAPGFYRREVPERIAADGSVVTKLDEDTVAREADALAAEGVEAIAIAFLFSFVNPAHELRAAEIVRARHPGLMISLSCEVDPAFREYERTCATAFDAYVKPVLDRYLAYMEKSLADAGVTAPLQVMQSRGGVCSSTVARQRPIRLFLSGPAAGVIGGRMVGKSAECDEIITVDIGGTSCDIALISGGDPIIRAEGLIDGYTVRVPMVDVNAIGAGGGSIAWLDAAGGLRVGPQSAGSEPGPACYGHGGTQATVTDASVVLGYVNPAYFAGGRLTLEPELARRAIEETIARPMGLTVEQAALGIHRVVNAQMVEGIRLVSVRRGFDPRRFALVPLGGGGPLHAIALARELGVERVIVPRYPGVLSANGLLAAPVEHENAAAFPRTLADLDLADVKRVLDDLDGRCAALMRREGIDPAAATVRHFADVCYVGQSYHLEIPLSLYAQRPLETLYRDFLVAHDRVYGHSTESPARIVNLRSVHQAGGADAMGEGGGAGAVRRPSGSHRILVADGEWCEAAVWERDALRPGQEIKGPAIVEQSDTTVLIEPGWRGQVHAGGSLILTPV
jgi:N-methylhydantoinase A/oxoprolinase/acetone carboxylase beta subunit